MRMGLAWGRQQLEIEVAEQHVVPVSRADAAPAVADPAAAVSTPSN
jgi:hypothetical protein